MIKSAQRVLAVLEFFRRIRRAAPASEIGRALGLPQSSTSMLLRDLVELGYLDYDAARRVYLPTLRVALMGDWIHKADPLASPLQDALFQLQKATAETVILGRQNGSSVQYLSVIQPDVGVQLSLSAGVLRPMTVTAIGNVLLASLSDEAARAIVRRNNADAASPHLRVREPDMLGRLAEIRRAGYALAPRSLITEGASMVAMLLPRAAGVAPLAIGVGGPTARFERKFDATVEMLRAQVTNLAPSERAAEA